MKIFSEDTESIKKELQIIKDNFGKINSKKLPDNIELLSAFYRLLYEVSGKEDKEVEDLVTKNEKYRQNKIKSIKSAEKKTVQNFINNKDFHSYISDKMIGIYDIDFNYYIERSLYLREEQMLEIICDFLDSEFGQAEGFKKLTEEKRIFRMDVSRATIPDMAPAAYSVFDYITRNNFITVAKKNIIKDITMMRILVHEFGHIMDNLDTEFIPQKNLVSYNLISGYREVYSMMYEKLFIEYLIKNNIFKESSKYGLKDLYLGVYDSFNELEYLTSLDDSLLFNERYRTEKGIIDQLCLDEDGEFTLSKGIFCDFDNANRYSYGGLIAFYFAYLKQNDIDKYNKFFEAFKNKRFNMFNPSIFEDIGTDSEEIIKIYEKGLGDVSAKKLILQ